MIYKLMLTIGVQAFTVALIIFIGLGFTSCNMDEKDYWEGNTVLYLSWEGSEPSYVRPVEIGDPFIWIYPHNSTDVLAIDIPDINVIVDLPEGIYDFLILSDNAFIKNEKSFYTTTLYQNTEISDSGERYIIDPFPYMLYVGVYPSYQAESESQKETSITVKPYLKEFYVDINIEDSIQIDFISCEVEITGIISSATLYNRKNDEGSVATMKLALRKILSPSGSPSFQNTFYLIDRSRENILRCSLTDINGMKYQAEIDISHHIYLSEMAFTASLECKDFAGETFTLSIASEETKEDSITIKPS